MEQIFNNEIFNNEIAEIHDGMQEISLDDVDYFTGVQEIPSDNDLTAVKYVSQFNLRRSVD